MLHFRRDSLGALEDCHRRYGPLVAFGWPIDTVIVFRPEDIRRVLVDNHDNYVKGAQTRELRVVMGEGLVTNDDRVSWARRRALVNHALGITAVRAAVPVVEALADAAVARLGAMGEVEITREMRRLTFGIAARVFLGTSLTDDEAEQIDAAVLYASHVVHVHMFQMVPLPYGVPTPTHVRFARHCRALDAIVARLLAGARAQGAPSTERPSILERLVFARDPDTGAPLSDRELRDEIVTLLVAGYETTANTLAWTLGLLAADPAAQQRARAEVDTAGLASDVLTFPKSHPYLHAVLLESMRLYTAIPMTSHRTVAEDTLAGHRIPPRTNVVIPTWVVHRSPEHWVDPGRFEPARFECPVHRKDAYLPFSKGERGCVGQVFAMMELATVVTRLVAHLDLASVAPELPRAVSEVSLKPSGPLRLRMTPRSRD